MEAKVDIIRRELIKPSSPTLRHLREHKLSFIDQFFQNRFIPFLFFYQNLNINVDFSQTSLHLKQSLSQTLTKFCPLAGKVIINPHGFCVVDCDDSGALFVEAKVDAPVSRALGHKSSAQFLPFDPISGEEPLLGTYPRNETLLAVQITYFEGGGISIGVCISHSVADFASLVTFMNSWSVANLDGDGDYDPCLVKKPNFDLGRHLFPPVQVVHDIHSRMVKKSARNQDSKEFTMKRFVFDREKLNQLKELAISSSQVLKDPTRVEVVTAFLSNEIAKMASSESKRIFRAWHAVNLRSRISSLSEREDFPFGNLFATSGTDPFSANNERGFGELVLLIRNAIQNVDDESVLGNSKDTVPLVQRSGFSKEEINLLFSSYCRYPTYEVDFGWGKPISVGPACTPNIPWYIILMDTIDGEGIEAWVTMIEDELALLPDGLLSLQAS